MRGRVILYVIFYSISIILSAAAGFLLGITGSSILYTISGILIILAIFIYTRSTTSARTIGSIFGLVAAFLMLAGGAVLSTDILGALGFFAAVGSLLTMGTLYSLAALVACVSALLYAFLAGGRNERVVFLILGIAALIYGIAVIINGLGPLITLDWASFFSSDLTGLAIGAGLIIDLVFISISGFIILATSGISLAVYGRDIFPSFPAALPDFRPAPVSATTRFCGNCGSPIKRGDKFCGKCRAELAGITRGVLKSKDVLKKIIKEQPPRKVAERITNRGTSTSVAKAPLKSSEIVRAIGGIALILMAVSLLGLPWVRAGIVSANGFDVLGGVLDGARGQFMSLPLMKLSYVLSLLAVIIGAISVLWNRTRFMGISGGLGFLGSLLFVLGSYYEFSYFISYSGFIASEGAWIFLAGSAIMVFISGIAQRLRA